MRIAQVAPLYESVPPRLYGGTERVVSYLTEELVRLGHEVTLFASADSRTRAHLEPCAARALRLDSECVDPMVQHVRMLGRVAAQAMQFDVVHFHVDYLHFPLSRALGLRQLTTLHGRLDIPGLRDLYADFADMPVVSISDAQRAPLPHANWRATIHHGLPAQLYRLHTAPGRYLAFIGRISPEKRVDLCIEVAIRAGMELRIAAKVDRADVEYFESRIRPLLGHPLVRWMGEMGDAEKDDFLGQAYALLFLIDWPEPFGLAMIEALACGTPVIAFARGSVPEVLRHGETGYIVDNVDEAVNALRGVPRLDRAHCRQEFEQRFSVGRMAEAYLAVYQSLITPRAHRATA